MVDKLYYKFNWYSQDSNVMGFPYLLVLSCMVTVTANCHATSVILAAHTDTTRWIIACCGWTATVANVCEPAGLKAELNAGAANYLIQDNVTCQIMLVRQDSRNVLSMLTSETP